MLEEKAGPHSHIEFTSSSGSWNNLSHYSLYEYDVKVSGEYVGADMKADKELLEPLDKLIVEENYLPE